MIQTEIGNEDFSVCIRQFNHDRPYQVLVEPEEWFRLGTLLTPSTTFTCSLIDVGVDEPVNAYGPVCLPAGIGLRSHGEKCCDREVLLSFSKSCFQRLTGRSGELSRAELRAGLRVTDPNIAYALNRLAIELETPGLASDVVVEALSVTLIVDLHRYLMHTNTADSNRLVTLSRRQLSLITDRTYQDGPAPSIAELAHLCELSERQIIRLFKRSTGQTLHAFVEQVRLKRAIELLTSTDLCLKEVSFRLGFSAPSSFSNTFRRLIGVSPRLYRQSVRLAKRH